MGELIPNLSNELIKKTTPKSDEIALHSADITPKKDLEFEDLKTKSSQMMAKELSHTIENTQNPKI